MPVAQVQDGMPIAPNHVYVIAPDTDLRVYEGALRVSRPSTPCGQRHPVDVLFASIATEQRERAIAIVLSGTGNNGTEGLKAIRDQGRSELGANPETAKFDGMPRSAIAADMADHVLAPEAMPEAVLLVMSAMATFSPLRPRPNLLRRRKARRRWSRFWSFCAPAPGTISAATSGARSADAFTAAWGSGTSRP